MMTSKTFLLFCFFLFVLHVVAVDFGVNHGHDFGLYVGAPAEAVKAKGKQPTQFSVKLEFDKNVWRDVLKEDAGKKLAQIAKDGFWQMAQKANKEKSGISKKNTPVVMTALAVGNNIYLTSSLRGTQSFVYTSVKHDHPIRKALTKCQLTLIDASSRTEGEIPKDGTRPWHHHINGASCGEQMALLMYFEDQGTDQKAKDALRGTHVVTVRNGQKREDYEKIEVVDPCGTGERNNPDPQLFGCSQVLEDFGILGILEGEEAAFAGAFELAEFTSKKCVTGGASGSK